MEKYGRSVFERVINILFRKYYKWFVKVCILLLNTLQNNSSRFMKFKRSYSNARNLGSAYKFAFGGDINRALVESPRLPYFTKWTILCWVIYRRVANWTMFLTFWRVIRCLTYWLTSSISFYRNVDMWFHFTPVFMKLASNSIIIRPLIRS